MKQKGNCLVLLLHVTCRRLLPAASRRAKIRPVNPILNNVLVQSAVRQSSNYQDSLEVPSAEGQAERSGLASLWTDLAFAVLLLPSTENAFKQSDPSKSVQVVKGLPCTKVLLISRTPHSITSRVVLLTQSLLTGTWSSATTCPLRPFKRHVGERRPAARELS